MHSVLSQAPLDEKKLFLEDKKQSSKIKIDIRAPSQRLFQDNMLSILRLVNCHPFAGVLRVQEVMKNDISINDLAPAIKAQPPQITRTSQFDFLMDRIFERCQERLTHLHTCLNGLIESQKIKFILESQPHIQQGLINIKDPSKRLEILRECELIDQKQMKIQSNKISQDSQNEFQINFTA